MTIRDRTICILGLGYVGLTLAAVMTTVGFRVVGVEIRKQVLEDLRRGKAHFHEPGLEEILNRATEDGNIEWHDAIPEGCAASVYIITVGTPLDAAGQVRLDMIERVAHDISERAQQGALVIMRSTVMIGTTSNVVAPILRRAGKSLSLAFCPERTVEGQALSELRQLPQIVGAPDLDVALRAMQIFQFLTPTVVRVSDYETAEMIKLVDNAQRDVLFALGNEIADMCDVIGISANEVIRSGKLGYVRHMVPLPGPVGGPCLSKDPYIMGQSMAKFGFTPELILAGRRINERHLATIPRTLQRWVAEIPDFPKEPVITLLGLAFKGRPPTDDLRGTTAKPIFEALKNCFPQARFRGFDAVVSPDQIAAFGVAPARTIEEAFADSNLVLILNNHRCFENMPLSQLTKRMGKPGFVYDLWHHYDARSLRLSDNVQYAAYGSHGRGRVAHRSGAAI